MDSDVIRYEIDRTTDDINQTLLILARRGRDARAQIRRWIPMALAAGGACVAGIATIIAVRRFRRRAERAGRRGRPPVGMA